MVSIELIGFIAGLFVAVSSFPQFLKSWKKKSTKDISVLWIIINLIGQMLWVIYGIYKESISLIVMSGITILMVGSILFLKLKYD